MRQETPQGFKDILPSEASWRASISRHVQKRFELWGYMPIETPALELRDVLESGGKLPGTPISLFDSDGATLVLRPDVTLPIARMVASRLDVADAPFRFRYTQQVFRNQDSLQAQSREFTQLGVETIGFSGTYADAEVIALLVESLRATALSEFTVCICTVGVLKGLIAGAGMDEQWQGAVLDAYHRSNNVILCDLCKYPGIREGFGEAISALPLIRGGREAILACRDLVAPLGVEGDLDDLLATWDLLEAAGVTDNVVVDFSVMSSFDYYTGFVMEAFAPGIGLPLGGGGRYDHMLEAFGWDAPAAGFAFSLERVMQALKAQGEKLWRYAPDMLIGGEDMATCFKVASVMRDDGISACLTARSDIASEARRRGIPRAVSVSADGSVTELDVSDDGEGGIR